MRQREFDYEEILRRALRTAADGIEPSGDGLERIRARLTTPRPLASAWLMAGYADVVLPALARLWSVLGSLRDWLRPALSRAGRQTRAAYRHSRPGLAGGRPPALLHRYGWLRPTAVAAAIVIAVAGGFALSQLSGAISNSGAENLPLSNSGTHPPGGSVDSKAASQLPGPSKTSGTWPGIHPTPSASASCAPSAPRRATSSHPRETPTPSRTPTSTPSATPSPTATATPSPTVTPSGTPTVTPSSTDGSESTPASPVLIPAGIVPPGNPAATPSPTRKAKPILPSPCEPALIGR
jgi:hypothetical protein